MNHLFNFKDDTVFKLCKAVHHHGGVGLGSASGDAHLLHIVTCKRRSCLEPIDRKFDSMQINLVLVLLANLVLVLLTRFLPFTRILYSFSLCVLIAAVIVCYSLHMHCSLSTMQFNTLLRSLLSRLSVLKTSLFIHSNTIPIKSPTPIAPAKPNAFRYNRGSMAFT